MLLSLGPELLLAALMFCGAVLYSSVGHAGASVYLALMALFGLPMAVMRPTALALNILVASIVAFRFHRAGYLSIRKLWPFVLGSIPAAFVGGYLHLPGAYYRPLVGVVLLIASAKLLWPGERHLGEGDKDPPVWLALLVGGGIGLLSGLTGTGGGIFLSPVLLLAGWSSVRGASAVASVFILCNSISGLAGNYASVQILPPDILLFAGAVLAGALVGSRLGIARFTNVAILRALGVVLLIAGIKLIGIY